MKFERSKQNTIQKFKEIIKTNNKNEIKLN